MAKKREFAALAAEDKRPLNKQSFQKLSGIFKYILPYKHYFIGGMLCLLFSSITVLAFPYAAGKLVDVASGKAVAYFNGIDHIALALIGILLVQSVFSFFRVYLFARVSERSMADLRLALYSKFMALPITFYDTRRTGELISRITSDVSLLQDTFSVTLAEFFRQAATLLIGTAVIFYFTPQLSVFMVATFPLLILMAMIFGKFIRKLSKKTQDELAGANVIVEETLQSIHTVKSFTSERYEIGRYRSSLGRVVDVALKAATYRGAFISFVIFALFGGIVAVMWYGATLVQNGEMTVGDLLSFVIYTVFIGGSMAGLGDLYGQIQKAIGSSERVLEIIDQPGEQLEGVREIEDFAIKGKISFNTISFSFPSRSDVQVLKNLSFEVNEGEQVALVGHSGAGKSTIIQLLMRFYPLQAGTITVGGIDIQKLDLHAFRKHIGIVPQEVILFGGTIGENIGYGKPNASQQAITAAAKKANALQFIDTFPEGLNTLVGERGIKLSGGQRQRIAIARAILKDPAILVLDEATNALDAESESLVQQALEDLMKNRTTIIIAHRLATIRRADKIFVLSDGRIVESGSHGELFDKSDGIYGNLVKLQLQDR